MILAQKSILEILNYLPADNTELESIKGLGKLKIKKYGNEILELVNSYCKEYGIERQSPVIPVKERKEKTETRRISFDLFKAGKSIREIAIERGLTTGTIESHLIQYIATGEISVFDLVPKLKTAVIIKHILENPGSATNELKSILSDDVSYSDIRAVQQHLAYTRSELESD